MEQLNKKITHLFLIRNEKEYQLANKVIQKKLFIDFVILYISNEVPYLIDKHTNLQNVMRWEDVGVGDLTLNRYWLENY